MRRLASVTLLLIALFASAFSLGCRSEGELAQERLAAQAKAELQLKAEQLARNQEAIKRVMHDASLTGDQDVQSHVDALRSIDIAETPPEFQQAFNRYVRAWDEAVQVRTAKEKVDADENNAAIGGTLATLFGSDAVPWSDHVAAEQKLSDYKARANTDIHTSYEDMRDAASKYGLQLG